MRVRGIVQKHKGLGKELGYPTANIAVPADAEEGVFIGYTKFEAEAARPSLIFVGAAETFGETDKRLESHMLDFNGDLYGKEIEVELMKKLRDNRKFESAEALVKQMEEDERLARGFFNLSSRA